MIDFKEIAYTNRISIKRAIARFCYLKNVYLSEQDFHTLVRRTQESGYRSAIKFLSQYFANTNPRDKKQLLYQFTIEYNAEVVYCRQFPEGNKVMINLLNGIRTQKQEKFFKEVLFDIIKANKLQEQIINKHI
jgi:hypothetical protein